MDRKSLLLTISLLLGLNSTIFSAHLGVQILPARLLFGIATLLFLPGWLLMGILRIRPKELSELIFLSVGLSVFFDMLIGILVNFLCPSMGVQKPFSLSVLLITWDVALLILLFVQQNWGITLKTVEKLVKRHPKLTNWDLFFILLPFLSLFGAYGFSFYGDTHGILLFYGIVSLTPLIFIKCRGFNRTFAVWSIGISLMWSTVFGMSWNYLWGYDINVEYYYAHWTLTHGFWNIPFLNGANSVASVVVFAPMLSILLNINIVMLFKIVYPLIFSLVPVVLLKSYSKILDSEVLAEFSVLFFMFFFTFFTEMMALARQMIAELYLALWIYAIIRGCFPLLTLLFGIALVISHYGIAYMFIFALLVLMLFANIFKRKFTVVNTHQVILLLVITLFWYQYTGGGFEFNKLTSIVYSILTLIKYLFSPEYSQGLALVVSKTTLLRQIAKWINLSAQGLIFIGILATAYRILTGRIRKYLDFYLVSFVFFAYDVAGVVVPTFANRLNTTRLYHITLLFISPYFVIGLVSLVDIISSFLRMSKINTRLFYKGLLSKRFLAVFLLVYFLFNSGFILVLSHDPHPPQWLDRVHSPSWTTSEIVGAKWLESHRVETSTIYSGNFKFPLFLGLGMDTKSFTKNQELSFSGSAPTYIYLGRDSVKYNQIEIFYFNLGGVPVHKFISLPHSKLWRQLKSCNKIYANSDVWIFINS